MMTSIASLMLAGVVLSPTFASQAPPDATAGKPSAPTFASQVPPDATAGKPSAPSAPDAPDALAPP